MSPDERILYIGAGKKILLMTSNLTIPSLMGACTLILLTSEEDGIKAGSKADICGAGPGAI